MIFQKNNLPFKGDYNTAISPSQILIGNSVSELILIRHYIYVRIEVHSIVNNSAFIYTGIHCHLCI